MFGLLKGLAALAAANAAETAAAPSLEHGMENAEIIALERERYERFTVPVTIDGEGPFRFMIDTGAQATILSDELAELLELNERSSATLIGMSSRRPIQTVAVDGIGLGKRLFNIAVAPIVARQNIGSADGILGIDSLQDQRVLLDFTKLQISVADASELGGNSGYEIIVKARRKLGQLIITQARIDGVRVAVIVDTGAQGSIGNPALLEKLRARELGTTSMTDINGVKLESSVHLGRMLEMNDIQLRSFPIVFADSPSFNALGLSDEPALVLGMNELKLFRRVAIDFKTSRILFDLPRSSGETDSRRHTFGGAML